MIQIIGLREYKTSSGRVSKKHAFFEQKWRAETVEDILRNFETYIHQVPEHERYNLYYTLAFCQDLEPRDSVKQFYIPFDIDNIDVSLAEETAACVVRALNLDINSTGIVCSGNGIQLIVKVPEFKADYIEEKRVIYKLVVARINQALKKAKLKGQADPAVWDFKRLFRVPGTENRKPDKPTRLCYVIRSNIEPQGFSLERCLGIEEVKASAQISLKALKRYPPADRASVLEGCAFLKHCKKNQQNISEPEWYASLGIIGHLEDGKELAHEYSREHGQYDSRETELKLEQAIHTAGPRTCDNISTLWDGCNKCEHFGKVKSPILIRSEEFIATETTGFYEVRTTPRGVTKKPAYNDLLQYFKNLNPYFCEAETGLIYVFNGVHWVEKSELEIKAFAEKHFNPKPSEAMRSEFYKKVLVNNIRSSDWCQSSTDRLICLENGVLNLDTSELMPHSEKYFFTGCLPYKYNPLAKAPRFEQFLDEITLGRDELKQVLLEYAGYATMSNNYKIHKVLILSGEGHNGKSTFMDVLRELVGDKLYSSLSLSALEDPAKRFLLVGKLFNCGEETNIHAMLKSEAFKTLSSGGEVDIKRLFHQPFQYRNRAKLIFACNQLPYTRDMTKGFFRRLLIVPFDADFSGEKDDRELKEKLFDELPGILNLCIKGYKQLTKRGNFSVGKVIEEQINNYKTSNDIYHNWFKENLQNTGKPRDFVSGIALFDNFKEYCELRNISGRAISYQEFLKRLEAYAKATDKVEYTAKRDEMNKYRQGLIGVSIERNF